MIEIVIEIDMRGRERENRDDRLKTVTTETARDR